MARPNRRNREQPKQVQSPQRYLELTSQTITQTSGPLPDPDILIRYNDACPGAADRIVAMAEAEAVHRRAMERTILDGQVMDLRCNHREVLLGQIFAFVIGLFVVGCGTLAIVKGFPIAGSVVSGSGVVGLVSAFIMGRKGQAAQVAAQDAKMPEPVSPSGGVAVSSAGNPSSPPAIASSHVEPGAV